MSKHLFCQTSVYPCINKHRIYHLYHFLFLVLPSGQSRRIFGLADLSRLSTFRRLQPILNLRSNSSIILKMFPNDSIVGTILVRGIEVIGCIQLCDRSSDLRRTVECSNVSLASSLFFSSSFFSYLEANAASRDFFFVARTPGLSTKSRSGSIRDLKCLSNAMILFNFIDF